MTTTFTPTAGFPPMQFTSPPAPVNTPRQSSVGNKKGSSATKPIENPLLTRSPPRFGGQNPSFTPKPLMLTNGSPSDGREPLTTVLGNANDSNIGLRRRKGVLKGGSTNMSMTLNGLTPPPRATLSLQGHMLKNNSLAGVNDRSQHLKSPANGRHPDKDKKTVQSALTLVGAHHGTPSNSTAITAFADSTNGSPKVSNSLTTSRMNPEEDAWILVSGVSTKAQRDQIFRIFDTYGRVVQRRSSSGSANWVAIEYQTRLEAEKALSHQPVQLFGGQVFCAVFRLTPENRRALFQQHYPNGGDGGLSNNDGEGTGTLVTIDGGEKNNDNTLFTMMPHAGAVTEIVPTSHNNTIYSKGSGELEEKDILLNADDDDAVRVGRRTICDELLAWWFGWN